MADLRHVLLRRGHETRVVSVDRYAQAWQSKLERLYPDWTYEKTLRPMRNSFQCRVHGIVHNSYSTYIPGRKRR